MRAVLGYLSVLAGASAILLFSSVVVFALEVRDGRLARAFYRLPALSAGLGVAAVIVLGAIGWWFRRARPSVTIAILASIPLLPWAHANVLDWLRESYVIEPYTDFRWTFMPQQMYGNSVAAWAVRGPTALALWIGVPTLAAAVWMRIQRNRAIRRGGLTVIFCAFGLLVVRAAVLHFSRPSLDQWHQGFAAIRSLPVSTVPISHDDENLILVTSRILLGRIHAPRGEGIAIWTPYDERDRREPRPAPWPPGVFRARIACGPRDYIVIRDMSGAVHSMNRGALVMCGSPHTPASHAEDGSLGQAHRGVYATDLLLLRVFVLARTAPPRAFTVASILGVAAGLGLLAAAAIRRRERGRRDGPYRTPARWSEPVPESDERDVLISAVSAAVAAHACAPLLLIPWLQAVVRASLA